jgi:hypothetical protein
VNIFTTPTSSSICPTAYALYSVAAFSVSGFGAASAAFVVVASAGLVASVSPSLLAHPDTTSAREMTGTDQAKYRRIKPSSQ